MTVKRFQHVAAAVALSGAVVLVSPLFTFEVAFAQSGCTCVLSATPSGPLGAISEANGDVFKTGDSGLVGAGAGTPVNAGDVITTGASSSANVSLGGGCNLAMGPSSQISITSAGGKYCVRLIQEQVGSAGGIGPGGILVAGGLTAGLGLFFGLGLTDPASR